MQSRASCASSRCGRRALACRALSPGRSLRRARRAGSVCETPKCPGGSARKPGCCGEGDRPRPSRLARQSRTPARPPSSIGSAAHGRRPRISPARRPRFASACRSGRARRRVDVLDLPGLYELGLDSPETASSATSSTGGGAPPDLVVVLVDACNLTRNLVLVGQLLATASRRRRAEHDGPGAAARNPVEPAPWRAARACPWCRWWRARARASTRCGSAIAARRAARTLARAGRPAAGRTRPSERSRPGPTHRRGVDAAGDRPTAATRHVCRAARSHLHASRDRHAHLHGGHGRSVLTLFSLAAVPMDLIDATFAGLSTRATPVCRRARSRPADRRRHWRHRRHGRVPAADLLSVLPHQPARRHRLSRARGVRDGPVPVSRSACRDTRSCRCSRRTRARCRAS